MGVSYRLDSGDQVRVIVYDEPTLSNEYTVSDHGTISFPMLGDIPVRSLTVEDVQKKIYDGLNGKYLVRPGISVEVSRYRPFYVLGEVTKPGEYTYENGLNVLAAIAIAGGYTVRANPDAMTVVRTRDGTSKEWHADRLTSIEPGDVIVIPERFF